MVSNSAQIDLNADAAFFHRENEVSGFDSSDSNVSVSVSVTESVEVRVRDHEFCRIGDGRGANESVNPGCNVMICGSGQEGFDKETEVVYRANDVEAGAEHVDGGCDVKAGYFSDGLLKDEGKKSIVELNDVIQNKLEYENKGEVTENGSTCIKFELNQEAQKGDNMIVCCVEDQNARVAFGHEGDGNGQNCFVDDIAKQGDGVLENLSTVVGDEDKIKAAETTSQGILQLQTRDVDIKECLLHEVPISRSQLCQVETPYLMKQPSIEVCGQAEVMQSQTIDINMAEALPLENIQNECCDFNLVVDLNPYGNLQEVDMKWKSVSSELNFCVSDLVWGKVRGHPWWPGQIFHPTAASERAKRHFKKDNYLVAYFGDQTFAWNDASKIKPFLMHFSEMEKQSNLEHFHYAVECALDEVSRRVEFGLSCPCVPKEVFTKLKTQIIANAGIQKHSSRRDGGDRFLNAITFEPIKLVNFIKLLAQSPLIESDRLDFAIARGQVLAFHRSKGYSQLPELIGYDGLFENDMEILRIGEKRQYDYQINKNISREPMRPRKKQRRLSDLMSDKSLCFPNDELVLEREDSKSVLHSSGRKPEAPDDISGDYYHKSQNRKLIQLPYVSVDEMWSQLHLAATDPTRGGYLSGMVNFFADFRNFISPHNSASLEPCEDSYWTDRIIQSIPDEQSLLKNQNEREEFLPVTTTETGSPSFKPQAAADGNMRSEPLQMEKHFEESSKEDFCPAALILEFTNLDSVPSETDLNKIFGRFGPLIESQTELLKKSRRARVVFKRLSDAESAFSSAGKYSIFGPSLFRYHLKVMPPSSKEATVSAGKRARKSSYGEGAF